MSKLPYKVAPTAPLLPTAIALNWRLRPDASSQVKASVALFGAARRQIVRFGCVSLTASGLCPPSEGEVTWSGRISEDNNPM